ncbi:protein of unknown function DUF423 [Emticicia oligotrophica DSM 17448]|uniref:DUF423 domain-containing protein n=1 Tax=Emticicia oligotrophica (strain DSM 17448 / CIP 109782 / MTCC 6937 / GPTSA100-15) TaxID=929562 RepID=A0ABM5MXH9_EMTOG|nr:MULTISPECIES: DUF423 domain-containing protein [Emticicia]AFK01804.1 protein of unknown function DUF423 [Emticicia oligotrophica DSM 17448]
MNKLFLQAGALLGAIGVMIGAFGAHALKPMLLASGRFETFETGVRYQFYHAIALILVGILSKNIQNKTISYSGYCLLSGVLIFSGALYTICFTGLNVFGAVAPIGGTLMVIGWLLLFWSVSKK